MDFIVTILSEIATILIAVRVGVCNDGYIYVCHSKSQAALQPKQVPTFPDLGDTWDNFIKFYVLLVPCKYRDDEG